MVNTTDNLARLAHPDSSRRAINTTAVVDEGLVYEDEAPDVLHVVAAPGWYARFRNGDRYPIAFWSVLENGQAFGVLAEVGEDGTIHAGKSVADRPGFESYVRDELQEDK